MKKILLILLMGLIILSMAACSNNNSVVNDAVSDTVDDAEVTEPEVEEVVIEGTLEELMEQVYAKAEIELPKTMNTEINDENIAYFLGTNEITYIEGLASEPMMSSIAHSVALLRVEDGADIEAIKAKIRASVDPRKWICVGVEEDEVVVDNIGNLIILIMDHESEVLYQSFLALSK